MTVELIFKIILLPLPIEFYYLFAFGFSCFFVCLFVCFFVLSF